MWYRFLIAVFIVAVFSSCEDNMILKSEKKMKSDIQGTWQKSLQGREALLSCASFGDSIPYVEYWTFKDDMLYTTFEYQIPVSCDRGTPDSTYLDGIDTAIVSKFKIDTKLFSAFIKFQVISGTGDSTYSFIDKWEFVTLDKDVLYLATDDPKSNSVVQLEFYKIK
jgi:hypothetical protein